MLNKLIPSIDKLKHFYLWGIFLALCLALTSNSKAYIICLSSAILWELIQKYIKKGTNSIKEMLLDIFFGGVLPILLHLITTI